LKRARFPVRIKISSPRWSIYCAVNFPAGAGQFPSGVQ
jgi:hypothetical protein